ncbi:hypothetical protein LCGC14_2085700 [marine sediment metagenome]|uniref:Uncharacterized protein n=1 Tax=marine sediment metagenome TaxID=412755 RepID=A0A0F9GSL0_9ZZZZ
MTERDIQNILYRHLKKLGHTMITPNVKGIFTGYWEADIISVTKAGIVNEFEIKTLLADYWADFKNKPGKHYDLKASLRCDDYEVPSYFYYVTNGFTIYDDGLPEYAGNIRITRRIEGDGYWITTLRKAPKLTKEKITDHQKDILLRVNNNKLWLERMRNNG